METPLFQVDTHMERKDYRKFLYIATFFQNPFVIPAILVMCGVGAVLASQQMGRSDLFYILALWGAISALVFTAVCFNVEGKNRRRVAAAQQAGALDRRLVMSFSEQEFFLENPAHQNPRVVRLHPPLGRLCHQRTGRKPGKALER